MQHVNGQESKTKYIIEEHKNIHTMSQACNQLDSLVGW